MKKSHCAAACTLLFRHKFTTTSIITTNKQHTVVFQAFGTFLVTRYGIDEVADWKFECWNEPNLQVCLFFQSTSI